jgi:uncharacterized membrane protein
MRAVRWVPLVLLALGTGLVADAVVAGRASLVLVLIVPVVSGASAEFLLGVVVLLLGFLTLPLAFMVPLGGPASNTPPRVGRPALPDEISSGVSGLILLGPVPIFFGGWKSVPRWARVLAAAVGALVVVAVVVLLVVR